jgi:hypothetical protein
MNRLSITAVANSLLLTVLGALSILLVTGGIWLTLYRVSYLPLWAERQIFPTLMCQSTLAYWLSTLSIIACGMLVYLARPQKRLNVRNQKDMLFAVSTVVVGVCLSVPMFSTLQYVVEKYYVVVMLLPIAACMLNPLAADFEKPF